MRCSYDYVMAMDIRYEFAMPKIKSAKEGENNHDVGGILLYWIPKIYPFVKIYAFYVVRNNPQCGYPFIPLLRPPLGLALSACQISVRAVGKLEMYPCVGICFRILGMAVGGSVWKMASRGASNTCGPPQRRKDKNTSGMYGAVRVGQKVIPSLDLQGVDSISDTFARENIPIGRKTPP